MVLTKKGLFGYISLQFSCFWDILLLFVYFKTYHFNSCVCLNHAILYVSNDIGPTCRRMWWYIFLVWPEIPPSLFLAKNTTVASPLLSSLLTSGAHISSPSSLPCSYPSSPSSLVTARAPMASRWAQERWGGAPCRTCLQETVRPVRLLLTVVNTNHKPSIYLI